MKTPFEIAAEAFNVSTEVANLLAKSIQDYTKATDVGTKQLGTKGISQLQVQSIAQKQANTMRLLARRIDSVVPKLESSTQLLITNIADTSATMPLFDKAHRAEIESLIDSLNGLYESVEYARNGNQSFIQPVESVKGLMPVLTGAANQLLAALTRIDKALEQQSIFCKRQVLVLEERLAQIKAA